MKLITYIFLCTVAIGYAQEKSEDRLLTVATDACECISVIEASSETKNQGIKDCINTSLENLKSDKESSGAKKPEMNYKVVESFLVQHCVALKELAFTENKKFKYASSDNVLAQLAYDDGMEYINSGDLENAISKFKKAVEIDPKFAFAWDNLGISYRKNQEYDKAIAAYMKSLEIYPEGRLPLLNIAIAYNMNKQYEDAIVYYNKVIEIYSEDPEG